MLVLRRLSTTTDQVIRAFAEGTDYRAGGWPLEARVLGIKGKVIYKATAGRGIMMGASWWARDTNKQLCINPTESHRYREGCKIQKVSWFL